MELLGEMGSSGTSAVFSTRCGREITAFDGACSTVTMVAKSALSASEPESEPLRYIAILAADPGSGDDRSITRSLVADVAKRKYGRRTSNERSHVVARSSRHRAVPK